MCLNLCEAFINSYLKASFKTCQIKRTVCVTFGLTCDVASLLTQSHPGESSIWSRCGPCYSPPSYKRSLRNHSFQFPTPERGEMVGQDHRCTDLGKKVEGSIARKHICPDSEWALLKRCCVETWMSFLCTMTFGAADFRFNSPCVNTFPLLSFLFSCHELLCNWLI